MAVGVNSSSALLASALQGGGGGSKREWRVKGRRVRDGNPLEEEGDVWGRKCWGKGEFQSDVQVEETWSHLNSVPVLLLLRRTTHMPVLKGAASPTGLLTAVRVRRVCAGRNP